jgi:Zn-dependent protease with chaperone function
MSFLLVAEGILGSIAGYAYHSLNQGRLTDAQTKLIKENSDSSNRIQSIFELVLKDMGLNDNCKIKLFITNGNTPPCSFGNFLSKERGLIVSRGLCDQRDNEIIAFIFKHEIAHIQKNHLLKIPGYSFLAGSIPLVASYVYSINPVISVAISALSTLATIFLYTRSSESEANAVAAQYSSKKEIQSCIDEFEKMRKTVKSSREYYKERNDWHYHLYSEEGNILMDFLHPPVSTEQALLEKTLRERSCDN